jgi:hypothetical protein
MDGPTMPGMTIEDTVEKVGPDIEALLADGVPRSKRMITAELVPRHAKRDVLQAILRMIVTGRLVQVGIKYALPRDHNRPVEHT